ncbi:GntR family transcriptional regulator (plasmid) [Sulfitobacter sp. LCG007]
MSDTEARRTTPQYIAVSDILKQRIQEGLYPVGSHLPTESQLSEEFSISRHTTREALRRLSETGLIHRRQGSGSRVLSTEVRSHYVHAMKSLDQLFAYASDTRLRFLEVHEGRPDPATGIDDDADWLCIEALRLERDADVPICFSLVYIDMRFADIRAKLADYQGAIYALMEQSFGIEVSEVEQVIEVVRLPPQAATVLDQDSDAWAARVVRRYLDGDGALLLASVNYHPVDHFSYELRMTRTGGRLG